MQNEERRLVRHLAWVVIVKLVVLTAIWWAFVREQRVSADVNATAAHLTAPESVPEQGTSP